MPKVEIPPRYRGVTEGVKEVRVEAETVQACLDAVDVVYPGFLELVVDSAGEIRKFVRLFLNGEELSRTTFDGPVDSDDVVSVVTGAAGG